MTCGEGRCARERQTSIRVGGSVRTARERARKIEGGGDADLAVGLRLALRLLLLVDRALERELGVAQLGDEEVLHALGALQPRAEVLLLGLHDPDQVIELVDFFFEPDNARDLLLRELVRDRVNDFGSQHGGAALGRGRRAARARAAAARAAAKE